MKHVDSALKTNREIPVSLNWSGVSRTRRKLFRAWKLFFNVFWAFRQGWWNMHLTPNPLFSEVLLNNFWTFPDLPHTKQTGLHSVPVPFHANNSSFLRFGDEPSFQILVELTALIAYPRRHVHTWPKLLVHRRANKSHSKHTLRLHTSSSHPAPLLRMYTLWYNQTPDIQHSVLMCMLTKTIEKSTEEIESPTVLSTFDLDPFCCSQSWHQRTSNPMGTTTAVALRYMPWQRNLPAYRRYSSRNFGRPCRWMGSDWLMFWWLCLKLLQTSFLNPTTCLTEGSSF